MHFDAIIFDLDGTLLNTLDDIADSANAVLGSRRYPVFAVEEYKMLVGDGVWTLMRRVVPDEEQTPELITECVTQLRDEYSRRWSSKTRPYDGIPRMLDDLSDRDKKIAVLTGSFGSGKSLMAERILQGVIRKSISSPLEN